MLPSSSYEYYFTENAFLFHVLKISIVELKQAFFWTFRKKLKAKITQAEKKLKQIFEKLKQIIQKLNNLPSRPI